MGFKMSLVSFLFVILVIVSVVCVELSYTKEYTVVKERKSFFGAMVHCVKNKQRLATINDQQEQDNLKKEILQTDDCEEWFWIGLSCLSKKGTFKWISTGQLLEGHFQTWCENQPDNWNNNEDCVAVYKKQDYKWNDAECKREFFFVCENEGFDALDSRIETSID